MDSPIDPMRDVANEYKQVALYTGHTHGSVLIDGQEVAHTMQCCHCNSHYLLRRNSKTKRGYCLNCSQVTCGRPQCDPCTPFERRLEMIEKRATREMRLGG